MAHSGVDLRAVHNVIGAYADRHTPHADRENPYKDLIGFVPPRVGARLAVTGTLDPELLRLQEEARLHAMFPACFDTKTAHSLHGRASRRAGASWDEMQAVVSLAYLFGGMPIANRGAEIIAQLAEAEAKVSEEPATKL